MPGSQDKNKSQHVNIYQHKIYRSPQCNKKGYIHAFDFSVEEGPQVVKFCTHERVGGSDFQKVITFTYNLFLSFCVHIIDGKNRKLMRRMIY